MNILPSIRALSFFLLFAAGSAFAQYAETAPTEAPAQPATVEPAPATPEADSGKTVPALNIAWNCGSCEQNPKIIPLINQIYAAEAAKAGYLVSTSRTVVADIIDFRQRPPGVRIMFGVMGGKDRLRLKLSFEGVEHTVGDTSANIIQGQNALCANVAEQIYRIATGQPATR